MAANPPKDKPGVRRRELSSLSDPDGLTQVEIDAVNEYMINGGGSRMRSWQSTPRPKKMVDRNGQRRGIAAFQQAPYPYKAGPAPD